MSAYASDMEQTAAVEQQVVEQVAERVFTALDRCDRCGAQAYTSAKAESWPEELLFCGHHTQKLEPGLVAAGALVTKADIPA